VRDFNDGIRENCTMLLPDAKAIREQGVAEAHRIRYEEWAASHDRSVFARIGIATPERGALKLYGSDGVGRIVPMEWPPNWLALRAAMTARMNGVGRPPVASPDSDSIPLPVFADAARGSELEWMIFDLNEEYLRTKVLPRSSRSI